MTAAPSSANMPATVLLPLPSPPVNPTRSILDRQPASEFRRAHRVRHQHGNGKRPDASGNWGISSGEGVRFGKYVSNNDRTLLPKGFFTASIAGEVALEFRWIGNAINARVENRSSRLDHSRSHERRLADRHHQDVCPLGERGQIA